jgi:hypothetical protein
MYFPSITPAFICGFSNSSEKVFMILAAAATSFAPVTTAVWPLRASPSSAG